MGKSGLTQVCRIRQAALTSVDMLRSCAARICSASTPGRRSYDHPTHPLWQLASPVLVMRKFAFME
jgi:hypothetical protein